MKPTKCTSTQNPQIINHFEKKKSGKRKIKNKTYPAD